MKLRLWASNGEGWWRIFEAWRCKLQVSNCSHSKTLWYLRFISSELQWISMRLPCPPELNPRHDQRLGTLRGSHFLRNTWTISNRICFQVQNLFGRGHHLQSPHSSAICHIWTNNNRLNREPPLSLGQGPLPCLQDGPRVRNPPGPRVWLRSSRKYHQRNSWDAQALDVHHMESTKSSPMSLDLARAFTLETFRILFASVKNASMPSVCILDARVGSSKFLCLPASVRIYTYKSLLDTLRPHRISSHQKKQIFLYLSQLVSAPCWPSHWGGEAPGAHPFSFPNRSSRRTSGTTCTSTDLVSLGFHDGLVNTEWARQLGLRLILTIQLQETLGGSMLLT